MWSEGIGVDEKSVISILGKWHPEQRTIFRRATPSFFVEDERLFERWDDNCVKLLKHEFMRFKVFFFFSVWFNLILRLSLPLLIIPFSVIIIIIILSDAF